MFILLDVCGGESELFHSSCSYTLPGSAAGSARNLCNPVAQRLLSREDLHHEE